MSQSIEQSFGDILRSHRESKKLSLSDLGGLSGLDRTTLAKIEKGKITPTIRVVFKIATGLDILPSRLIIELEKTNPLVD